jgi:hypothetical protein
MLPLRGSVQKYVKIFSGKFTKLRRSEIFVAWNAIKMKKLQRSDIYIKMTISN